MRVTKEKAAAHRAAIVKAAGRLFRKRGIEGVGLAEITKAAGLTHGGFYGHFDSKDQLAAEACEHDFERSVARLAATGDVDGLLAYVDTYLSEQHRDHPHGGCPMPAYIADVPRQDRTLQNRFAAGVGRFIAGLSARLPMRRGGKPAERRARAITILSAMVGGMALARATARSDRDQSAEILAALRKQLADFIRNDRA